MSAEILRMERPSGTTAAQGTGLSRALVGHTRRGPTSGGMFARIEGEAAVRRFVRRMGARQIVSDGRGKEDLWAQVEDVVALVPMMATGVLELEALAQAVRAVLLARRCGGLATVRGRLAACDVEISASAGALRLKLHGPGETRILTVRLDADGARRIDDATART